jgi:hypothetical protein
MLAKSQTLPFGMKEKQFMGTLKSIASLHNLSAFPQNETYLYKIEERIGIGSGLMLGLKY